MGIRPWGLTQGTRSSCQAGRDPRRWEERRGAEEVRGWGSHSLAGSTSSPGAPPRKPRVAGCRCRLAGLGMVAVRGRGKAHKRAGKGRDSGPAGCRCGGVAPGARAAKTPPRTARSRGQRAAVAEAAAAPPQSSSGRSRGPPGPSPCSRPRVACVPLGRGLPGTGP